MISETWDISIYCPPMKVNSVSLGLRRAEREPCMVTITKADGKVMTFEGVIKATDVRGFLLWWTVDACELMGNTGDGSLLVKLPPEPVRLKGWTMTALAIDADVLYQTSEGRLGVGSVRFPDCPTTRIGWRQYLAAAVTAEGSITFP